jgi:hypothetical protein
MTFGLIAGTDLIAWMMKNMEVDDQGKFHSPLQMNIEN